MKKSLLLAVLAIGLVAAACAPPTPVVVEKEVPVTVEKEVVVVVTPTPEPTPVPLPAKVKIGVGIDFTGALAEFGAALRNGSDLAAKHFAEAGFPIEVKYADTETSAMPGVEAARTLVDVERVQALVGSLASGVTIPIAESVCIPGQIPQISPASTSPLLSVLPADEGKDFLFRTCPSDALQGVIMGKLAADLGYKTVAVLYVNNAYGLGLAKQFQQSFEFRGGKVTAMVPHDEAPAATYVSELRKAAEAKPEVLAAISYPGHATVYLKEAIEGGFFTKFLFCDGTKSVEMPAAVGPEHLAGFFGTVAAPAMGDSYSIFVAEYMAVYGALPPLPYIDGTYDAVAVIGLAAAAAEARGLSITGVNIRDMLRVVANPPGETITPGAESIKKALELLREGKDINYEGAAGSVDFDENGDVVTPIMVWKYVEEPPYVVTERVEIVIPPK
ncbi:MAG: amino acid ABC transporter substrate-binding protein [Chloroflexi bacterium]|nr:amino acid ABC transporter substrate-binding protein [Chloroflexota bacterium]